MEEKILKKKNNSHKLDDKSIISGVLLAFVAVCGMIFMGVDTSYATEPDTQSSENAEIEETESTEFTSGQLTSTLTTDNGLVINTYSSIPVDENDEAKILYSYEHNVSYLEGIEATFEESVEDEGLSFLLEMLNYEAPQINEDGSVTSGTCYHATSVDGGSIELPGYEYCKTTNKELQTWMGQVAIWLYLNEKEDLTNDGIDNDNIPTSSPNYISSEDLDKIKTAKGIMVNDDTSLYYTASNYIDGKAAIEETDTPLYNEIEGILAHAMAILDANLKPGISLAQEDTTEETKITTLEEKNYYKTPKMIVNRGSLLSLIEFSNEHTITLVNAPEGTRIYSYNSDGSKEETEEGTVISDGSFEFMIPEGNITEENKILEYRVDAAYDATAGHVYTVAEGAKVLLISNEERIASKTEKITLNPSVEVPDTGLSVSNITMLIGLLIALIGTVVIVINSKHEIEVI